ncbi:MULTISPECIES: ABC transporter ATP-binding protein [Pseudanabaena]|uniref:Iron-chelate-transporting ATPase n=2 Tax=Pseudanabaena TaxID=1152 RepID=L8N3I1_9CYAN|nr:MULTISPECIES: ABC transporter ATP-binding protein [Pseudanabaena]ELS34782.1 Iron-chelate-transporting ATPase [Pseudanabaena biceps PCC 7429]MDG3493019.1 ABC transporter ATP-binding protein [Pseudanabaena catenata USMAC16]
MTADILQIKNLSCGYGNTPTLENINFEVYRGEWLSIIGANGCGKSTLLKTICGLLLPQHGSIFLNGKNVLHDSAICRYMAFLPQQPIAPEGLTVYQMVCLGRNPHQTWWQWQIDRQGEEVVERALELCHLTSYRDRTMDKLSGGERQRTFIALALAQDPQVILLDEPTTFLDIRYQLELLELLKNLNRNQGLTIVMVLHDMNLAARYSDRIAIMEKGTLLCIGKIDEVITTKNIEKAFAVKAKVVNGDLGIQVYPYASL